MNPALHLAEHRVGCIASALVLLRRHVRHVAAPRPRLPRGDDRRLARHELVTGRVVRCGRLSGCLGTLSGQQDLNLGRCPLIISLVMAAALFGADAAGPVISASFRPFRFGGGL